MEPPTRSGRRSRGRSRTPMPGDLLVVGVILGGLFLVHTVRSLTALLRLPTDAALRFAEGLETAHRLHGFDFEPRRPGWREAKGRRGDYQVFLDLKTFEGTENVRRHDDVYVSLRCDRLPFVNFSPEKGAATDILTGDALFDDAVEMAGDPVVLAALLDEDLRLRLRNLVALGGRLQGGKLSWMTTLGFTAGAIPRMLAELA